jgi:4a-hydroxytetrahydrobiopterin dehydratase
MDRETLAARHSKPLPAGSPALDQQAITSHLSALKDWKVVNGELTRTFSFKNYYETMAFVNAVAWISHGEDHHPDMAVGYNRCVVRYRTHSVGGLSENDFICAAKVDGLMQG